MALETANNQSTLIQAVSGVAGDIFDTGDVMGYSQMGVALDIAEDARKNGYGLDATYPGMAGLLTDMNGKQCAYPCNGGSTLLWINLKTLKNYGFDRPPLEWTPEEFEKFGKEYVAKANKGLDQPERFLCESPGSGLISSVCRSKGEDLYNETMTRCIADTPTLRKTIELLYKWAYVDHIIPTAADLASMNTDAGYGGANFSNFLSGKYAIIVSGRYCLIRFREIEKTKHQTIQFGVSQLPMYGYKNSTVGVRAAMPYRGTKYPKQVKLFLKFLSQRSYNAYIVSHADGLPPNPDVVKDLMAEVKKIHPNEHDCNELEFKWARTIALPAPYSPYVKSGASDWLSSGVDRYMNRRCTLVEAGKFIQDRYNQEIEISKSSNPVMKKAWDKDWKIQQKIDAYKKEGKKIPAQWIKNPFYLKYYRDKGMLDETGTGGVR